MKKILLILSMLGFLLLNNSCEDNFEPEIYGKLFSSNFPRTEADFENYMMTCYLPYTCTWGYSVPGGEWLPGFHGIQDKGLLFNMYKSSDIQSPWDIKSWGGNWLKMSQANFTDMVNNGRSGNQLEKIREITRMTQIIGDILNAPDGVIPDDARNGYLGEARLCRGMAMYYLLHLYGPVPVIVDPELVGNTEAEQNLARPTLDQMSKYIEDDFEFAIANITFSGKTGRFTKDFARFFMMRHCLNEGSHMDGYYDRAIALFGELKNGGYSLYEADGDDSYANVFKQGNKFNSEIVMAISTSPSADGESANGNFNPFSWYSIPNDASKYEDEAGTIPSPFWGQGGGWGQVYNVSKEFYETYEDGDIRKNSILTTYKRWESGSLVEVGPTDIGNKWSGYIVNKYPVEIQAPWQPTDFPLARWSDVLLMHAEAVARKNNAVPTGEAMDNLNAVRNRAGLPALSGSAVASYDGFMTALLMERGHELFCEGMRKIDLIRFGKFKENCQLYKGETPSHQYLPLPDYFIQQAETYGVTITDQFYSRPGWN